MRTRCHLANDPSSCLYYGASLTAAATAWQPEQRTVAPNRDMARLAARSALDMEETMWVFFALFDSHLFEKQIINYL